MNFKIETFSSDFAAMKFFTMCKRFKHIAENHCIRNGYHFYDSRYQCLKIKWVRKDIA